MKLNHVSIGPEGGLPILLVHGLFGQGRNLGALARRLAESRRVVTADLRNHGDSPQDPDHSYAAMAGDLAELIGILGGRADLVGHSMGGKASMALALTRPQMVRKLAVMDIAPIAYRHDQSHHIDAMESLDLRNLRRRSDADRLLAALVDEPGTRAFLLQSLDLKADPPAWRLNLPALRAAMADLVGWPEDLPQGTFDGPVLEIAGARSDYLSKAGQKALRASFPQARVVKVKDAGHWLHADAPDAVAAILSQFLGAAEISET
ncbi:MAG: alpha/beta fold hydrolase [Paracoccus sp. (in: a-proteobacteria)]|uniref:alpha/beta fold hydrolase n=1 Tax=unclassified Paracoccus (in: a-proteobacteria) TaxID=2688777 RepID=UPI000C4BDD19|nr:MULTISPECIES: alpha/beta fold hydrolase [unclassified Paracoccus (in: a-proteobacteria)]MAN56229.1 alpha/beta hydrolase [Paracoccus sp. (in: a-proteobacteria)]MBA50210.1 alpha/beta hydrolase [Paracoccus sp. (in: a-proteobacteria)]|tara:strand:+ start:3779 stop:4567 length:789 start_codon:yes stop_codon:yes gene_type:complete